MIKHVTNAKLCHLENPNAKTFVSLLCQLQQHPAYGINYFRKEPMSGLDRICRSL